MKLHEVKSQSWATLIPEFYECQNCHIVDADNERMRVGHRCKKCGNPSEGGSSYFGFTIVVLVEIIQDYYLMQRGGDSGMVITRDEASGIGVLLTFTTLVEVLVERMIWERGRAKGNSNRAIEALLEENMYIPNRLGKVFESLTGEKWKMVINDLSTNSGIDYRIVARFCIEAQKKRNRFLHSGKVLATSRDYATDLVEMLYPLFHLFTRIHNRYLIGARQQC